MRGHLRLALGLLVASCTAGCGGSDGGDGWAEVWVTTDPLRVEPDSTLEVCVDGAESSGLRAVVVGREPAAGEVPLPGTIVLRHDAVAEERTFDLWVQLTSTTASAVPCLGCGASASGRCLTAVGTATTPGAGGRVHVVRLDPAVGVASVLGEGESSTDFDDDLWAIAVGATHSCVRDAAGGVRCWGGNGHGELGRGTITSAETPGVVPALGAVVEIALGRSFSCARNVAGEVRCWGLNDDGQAGGAPGTDRTSPGSALALGGPATAVAAGAAHACAALAAGGASCWGAGLEGRLGNGSTSSSATPVSVGGLGSDAVIDLALGAAHSCALRASGTVACWGANARGQLGVGGTLPRLMAETVPGLAGVTRLAAGDEHTCARLQDGGVRCWGANDDGQLGDRTTDDRDAPVSVVDALDIVGVSAGAEHACAWDTRGSVHCWGRGDEGQLGDGATVAAAIAPVIARVPSRAMEVASGRAHTCARFVDDDVACWGADGAGQLGSGGGTPSLLPVPVEGIR